MKKVLIINGHPNKESFNFALANAYKKGAETTNAIIDVINIRDLNFNPNLEFGYQKRTELEPDLLIAIDKIKNADHLVWIFPMWWSSFPAIMKGFIDRTFLPGITFDYKEGKIFQEKLLKGKTARIIITADSPRWYNYFIMKDSLIQQFKKGTLEFCGIKPVKTSYFAIVKKADSSVKTKWLNKVTDLGKKLK